MSLGFIFCVYFLILNTHGDECVLHSISFDLHTGIIHVNTELHQFHTQLKVCSDVLESATAHCGFTGSSAKFDQLSVMCVK